MTRRGQAEKGPIRVSKSSTSSPRPHQAARHQDPQLAVDFLGPAMVQVADGSAEVGLHPCVARDDRVFVLGVLQPTPPQELELPEGDASGAS